MFVKNVGGIDRFLRILLGMVLLALIFVGPKTLWGLLGLIPFLTIFRQERIRRFKTQPRATIRGCFFNHHGSDTT